MLTTRRSILLGASLAATPIPAWARSYSGGAFTHGVASGDPTTQAVILWTRFAPRGGDGRIGWEIGEDESFARVARRGSVEARAANDYCVKIDARGLRPGRRYFYRFLSADGPSPTGLTRTAPEGATEALTLAFFSCANLPFGYFHAYGDAAAREDIDLCLHLGDYIYETQRGIYPGAQQAVAGRVIEPATETVTLADYYARYGSYHADPDLQELRRVKPLSVTFDDHEITNDPWMHGAQNHQEATEGAWDDRVAHAMKAYYDWMPIRPPVRNGPRVQRALDWGDLARIVILDTRLAGRDKQLDYTRELAPALNGPNPQEAIAAFRARLNDPNRQLLGAVQEAWLSRTLAQSKARGQTWQVIAQQIVTGVQNAPRGLSRLLPANAAASNWFAGAERLAEIGLPWNLDCWDGYPAARERLLAMCAADAANALILSGDSHNAWLHNLAAPGSGGRIAALEFAGGSVTSPGFESGLTNAQPGEREAVMQSANPHLVFTDLTNRGYGAARLTRTGCEAEWRAVSDIRVQPRGETRATRITAAASANGPGGWTL